MKNILLILFALYSSGQINAQIITTVAGNGTGGYVGDGGPAINANLMGPFGIAIDATGNLYITDYDSLKTVIRKVDASGIITTIAGIGPSGFSGDGGPATSAKLSQTKGIAVDKKGNLFIADNGRIRKIGTNGIITTYAGGGNCSGYYCGDGGPATSAKLNQPIGVAVDSVGNLYIADEWNYCVRKVDTSGIITTIAGNGTTGFSGDGGPASTAILSTVSGITLDTQGNIYISDRYNNWRVRKINTSGIINTVAGNGTMGFSGDGGLATNAQLYEPYGLSVDHAGNLFIADMYSDRIRVVNTSNIITTFAGNGTLGYAGDGGPAVNAKLFYPSGLATDISGNLFIADWQNKVIRKVDNLLGSHDRSGSDVFKILLFPNPTSDQFFIDLNITDKLVVDLYDVNGRHVFSANVMDKSNISVANLDNGIYTMTIKAADRVVNKKLAIVR